ncbi:MAG: aminopeptidase, partial [Clostridia bacterium]|nr:aminopeptidase [Clostridia bacterium]
MSEKSAAKALKEKLFYKKVNGRQGADETLLKSVDDYCEGYKKFLNTSKTEREAAKNAIEMAKKHGFAP